MGIYLEREGFLFNFALEMIKTGSRALKRLLYVVFAVGLAVVVPSCGTSKRTTARRPNVGSSAPVTPHHDPHHPEAGPKAQHALAVALVDEARSWLGTPYLYGGKTKDGADCSGFVMQVYKNAAGINIPRNSRAQNEYCANLKKQDLAIGDLVFFSSKNSDGKVAHVGMFIGDGKIIHASSSRGVVESSLEQNYYVTYFYGCGRIPEIAQLVPLPKYPEVDKPLQPEPLQFAANVVEPQPESEMQMPSAPESVEVKTVPESTFEPEAVVKTPEQKPDTQSSAVQTPSASTVVKNAFKASKGF